MPRTNKTKSANKVKRAASQTDRRKISEEEISQSIKNMLAYIGDDPDREGLKETPKRII